MPLSVESIHEMLYQVARSPPPLPTSQHAKETPHKTDMHCTERQPPRGGAGAAAGRLKTKARRTRKWPPQSRTAANTHPTR